MAPMMFASKFEEAFASLQKSSEASLFSKLSDFECSSKGSYLVDLASCFHYRNFAGFSD